MLENISSQPVWIQIIFGLCSFFFIIWLLSAAVAAFLGELEDRRYSKNQEAQIRKQNQRDKELAEANPSVFEEALYITHDRTRTIQEIREYVESLQPAVRKAIEQSPKINQLIQQIKERREGEGAS